MRLSYIPKVKEGKEQYCTGCRRCELNCPDWAIYVLEKEEENKKSPEKAKT
ncbi:MAG: 4Fe-4S ferredoxin [Promethearchaeota archaeon]|jgi:NAD-dependent dihydropyrimidine dehydrogenase PreA subunit|nr:MAG: 4Fe-4S ferredoxin [Candidatus Lokiarchaeota archaeon]